MRARLLALVVALGGCSSCEEPPAPETETEVDDESDETPRAPSEARVGTVRGTVKLAEGFSLPSYPREQVTGAQATSPLPEHCSPVGDGDLFPLGLHESRGLAGMMVAATAGDPDEFTEALGDHEPVQHVVTITDCRLSPRLVTATRGDELVVRNESNHPFLPRLGPSSFMRGIQGGESVEFQLDRGGVVALGCGFGSPCGRTDVVVLYRPVHTTTGEDGSFTLDNVPAGLPVTVRAWHPVYGRVDVSTEVELEEGATETLDLVLSPPAEATPEPGDESAGSEEDAAESDEPTPAPQ